LPEDREELGALWDRFLLRYNVQYIRDKNNFKALMMQDDEDESSRTTIDLESIKAAQEEASKVDIGKIMQHIDSIKDKMKDKNITASDRRWKGIRRLIKASAWLGGRQQASDDDLQILMHALWDDPKQVTEIKQIILETANPLDTKAQDFYDQALEVYELAMKLPDDDPNKSLKGAEANGKLKKIIKDLNALRDDAQGRARMQPS
jgi:MoxR-like ATPase